jgi:hypothetical protein
MLYNGDGELETAAGSATGLWHNGEVRETLGAPAPAPAMGARGAHAPAPRAA